MKDLLHNWEIKAFMATILALLVRLFHLDDIAEQLAVLSVPTLMLLDLIAGTWAAKERGDFKAKLVFGKTIRKLRNYSITVVALTVFGNAFSVASGAVILGCFALASNELVSALVNANGIEKAQKIWRAIFKRPLPKEATDGSR